MSTDQEMKLASWALPEAVWQRIEPLIPPRKSPVGRPRTVNLRQMTAGIVYVLRTGIQGHALPRERFGPPSTVYYSFAQWVQAGVFAPLWAAAVVVYDDLQGRAWTWQRIDGAMTKAPLGGGDRPQSHGPWQAGHQTPRGARGTRDPYGAGGGGG